MAGRQEEVFPAFRLTAEYSDGARLLFDGLTYEQARENMEQAQWDHGEIVWWDGVTDEHYENGMYYAAHPPHCWYIYNPEYHPDKDPEDGLEQQSLY